MRLPPIPPERLSPEQKPLYDALRAGIAKRFKGFRAMREDGALLGPFNPWLHEPVIGKAVWELTEALSAQSSLPQPVREIAILVTGARFRATYELYAHVRVAERKGLPNDKVATIVAGERPADLTAQEALAYDTAAALNAGGVLPRITYDRAVEAFGQHGTSELIYLVGLYALVCVTLNGFDVPVPEQQDEQAR